MKPIPKMKGRKGSQTIKQKIYIAGKITGLDNYKELFDKKEKELLADGHKVMNPTILPEGFDHAEYMKICFSMIDVCDAVFFLDNYHDSKGAIMELEYAVRNSKYITFEGV